MNDKTVIQVKRQVTSVPMGTQLNNIYELDEQIAAGGMGEIYRGRQIETGDPVAIKMIKPEFADNEAVLALFRKEASALNSLQHDSIVRYYMMGVDRTLNRHYLAMEFVEGRPLSELLEKHALPYEEVDALRKRVASGMQVAHDKGIIHRDLSPDNIILPDEDVRKAKIIDFGIAKSTKLGQATVIGDGFAGKYNYVSPEQLGMFGGTVTNRSDVYSLGLVLAETLLGKAIDMSGSQADVIEKRRAVPDLSKLDERLRPLIEKMLQPNPEDRIHSMMDVFHWEYRPPRVEPQAVAPKSGGGSKGPMIGIAAALVAGIGIAGYFVLGSRGPTELPATPPAPAIIVPQTAAPQTAVIPPVMPQRPAEAPAPSQAPSQAPARGTALTLAQQSERIENYVRHYDGDPCTFAMPRTISPSLAVIDVISGSRDAIRAFEADFRSVNGFDSQTTGLLLSAQQCEAVSFLQRIDARADPSIVAKVLRPTIRAAEAAQLAIAGAAGQTVAALLVHENGTVRNITDMIRREGTEFVLVGRLDDLQSGPPTQKLVLGLVSARPLQSTQGNATMPAAQFFGRLAEEMSAFGAPISTLPVVFRFSNE